MRKTEYFTQKPVKRCKKRGKRRRTKRRLTRLGKLVLLAVCLLLVLAVTNWCHSTLPYWLYPTPYYEQIVSEAEETELDPLLVLAIAKVESGFNPDAVSTVGAVGIMQLMPDTARWLAGRLGEAYLADELADVEYNIHLGTRYLRFLLDYWGGDINRAVASYNAGQTKVAEWLNSGVWDGTLAAADNIPYQETRDYLKRVLAVYQQYHELY